MLGGGPSCRAVDSVKGDARHLQKVTSPSKPFFPETKLQRIFPFISPDGKLLWSGQGANIGRRQADLVEPYLSKCKKRWKDGLWGRGVARLRGTLAAWTTSPEVQAAAMTNQHRRVHRRPGSIILSRHCRTTITRRGRRRVPSLARLNQLPC